MKLNLASLSSFSASKSLHFFPNEHTVHNFNLSDGGRNLVKWNSNKITFNSSNMSDQMIHGDIIFGKQSTFSLTMAYVHNSARDRKELWDLIWNLASSVDNPWILTGDFNCTLFSSNKIGGNHIPTSKLSDFRSYFSDNGLLELSSLSLFYTWSNLQQNSLILCKLNRVLYNVHWLRDFPQSSYKVVPPCSSDHTSLIIISQSYSRCVFRF